MKRLLVVLILFLFCFDCTSVKAESTPATKALAGFFQIAGIPPKNLGQKIGHWKCEYIAGKCHLVWVEPTPPSVPAPSKQYQDNICYGAHKLFYGITLNGKYIYRQTEGFVMAAPTDLKADLGRLNEVQVDFLSVDDAPTFRVVSELAPRHGRGEWGWTKRTIDFTGFWRHFPLYSESHLGGEHDWHLSIGIVNPDTDKFDPFCELDYVVVFVDPTMP